MRAVEKLTDDSEIRKRLKADFCELRSGERSGRGSHEAHLRPLYVWSREMFPFRVVLYSKVELLNRLGFINYCTARVSEDVRNRGQRTTPPCPNFRV